MTPLLTEYYLISVSMESKIRYEMNFSIEQEDASQRCTAQLLQDTKADPP